MHNETASTGNIVPFHVNKVSVGSASPRDHLKGDGLDYMRRAAPIQPPEPAPIIEDEWPNDPFAVMEQAAGPLACLALILIAIFAP